MDFTLVPAEVRVLGCLIEKDITTPEYYPLTANAIVNACNQKSNREPVVAYDEPLVADILQGLREKRLASMVTGAGNRVPKFSHRLVETLNLGRRETALLCELMLRGPQTLGELRDRAGRMHGFTDVDEVERCLGGMAERPDQPLVVKLPRQPGMKESRYGHLLSGPVNFVDPPAREFADHRSGPQTSRLTELESEVAGLRERLEKMERRVEEFIRQFS